MSRFLLTAPTGAAHILRVLRGVRGAKEIPEISDLPKSDAAQKGRGCERGPRGGAPPTQVRPAAACGGAREGRSRPEDATRRRTARHHATPRVRLRPAARLRRARARSVGSHGGWPVVAHRSRRAPRAACTGRLLRVSSRRCIWPKRPRSCSRGGARLATLPRSSTNPGCRARSRPHHHTSARCSSGTARTTPQPSRVVRTARLGRFVVRTSPACDHDPLRLRAARLPASDLGRQLTSAYSSLREPGLRGRWPLNRCQVLI